MKFPEKFYLGIQDYLPLDSENPPLGFATPWGTDKAFDSRRETVDNWVSNYGNRKKNYQGFIIDNDPQEGFTFEKSVSRWITSNKWFTINDPRGFQLQISAENLGNIILNNTIEKGKLIGKFVWGRNGSVNYLCGIEHPEYNLHKDHIQRPIKPGDKIRISNQEVIFVGIYYLDLIGITSRYVETSSGRVYHQSDVDYDQMLHGLHSYNYNRFRRPPVLSETFSFFNKDAKPWYVYETVPKNLEWQGLMVDDYNKKYMIARKPSTFQIIAENCEFTVPDDTFVGIFSFSNENKVARMYPTKKEMNANPALSVEEIQNKLIENEFQRDFYGNLFL